MSAVSTQKLMIDPTDLQLIVTIQEGLPLLSRPYAFIGQQLGINETEVIERLSRLKKQGLIKRLGVIVKHSRLGYQSNAMVVFDIPNELVAQKGQQISLLDYINLCYLRPRHGEQWPYNLFCMIHGKSRQRVLEQIEQLIDSCAMQSYAYDILFSQRCFKQRGAIYASP